LFCRFWTYKFIENCSRIFTHTTPCARI
jgi:hypothetical protein